jgi:hypothetical protein
MSFITISPSPCTHISALVSSKTFFGNSEQCGPPIMILISGFVSLIILINSDVDLKL